LLEQVASEELKLFASRKTIGGRHGPSLLLIAKVTWQLVPPMQGSRPHAVIINLALVSVLRPPSVATPPGIKDNIVRQSTAAVLWRGWMLR
jgi:hypothetical protein